MADERGLGRAFEPLRNRSFRRWFIAQIFSASGNFTQAVGLAWLVVQLHGGGVALAIVTGALFVPTLLFGPALGGLSDRYGSRPVLLWTNVSQGAIAAILAVLAATGLASIPILAVFSLVGGVVFAMDQPARQLLVFDLVGSERISSAISLNEVVLNGSRVFGPAAGGAAIAVWGAWACFALNAVSFLPAVWVLVGLPMRRTASVRRVRERGEIRQGLSFAWSHRPVLAALILAAAVGPVYNIGVTMPLMATRVFHTSGAGYGAMLAAFGLGAVPGALYAATRPGSPSGREIAIIALITSSVVLVTAGAPSLPFLLVALAFVGATSILFIARTNALVLLSAPPALRGRIMGVWSVALPGMNPVTGLAVGIAAALSGPRVAYGLTGVVMVVVTVSAYRALQSGRPPS